VPNPNRRMTLTAKVREFHVAMGLPIATAPMAMSSARAVARAGWIKQEAAELETAITVVDQVDAAVDLVYLALGTLVELGVELEDVFDLVHKANMSKRWPDGVARFDAEGKLLKPPGWAGPEAALETAIGQ